MIKSSVLFKPEDAHLELKLGHRIFEIGVVLDPKAAESVAVEELSSSTTRIAINVVAAMPITFESMIGGVFVSLRVRSEAGGYRLDYALDETV